MKEGLVPLGEILGFSAALWTQSTMRRKAERHPRHSGCRERECQSGLEAEFRCRKSGAFVLSERKNPKAQRSLSGSFAQTSSGKAYGEAGVN